MTTPTTPPPTTPTDDPPPPTAQGEDAHDCLAIEEGEVVAAILIPGIRFAATSEWKETIKHSPQGTPFFGERGLLRKEPRAARMICKT